VEIVAGLFQQDGLLNETVCFNNNASGSHRQVRKHSGTATQRASAAVSAVRPVANTKACSCVPG